MAKRIIKLAEWGGTGSEAKHIIDQASVKIMGYHEWLCGNGQQQLIHEAFHLGRRYQAGRWPKKKAKAKKT